MREAFGPLRRGFWECSAGDVWDVGHVLNADGSIAGWCGARVGASGLVCIDEQGRFSDGEFPSTERLVHPVVFAKEDPDAYQNDCVSTLHAGVDVEMMCLLGLSGELGEIVEPIKKARFHGKPAPTKEYISKEIGDMLWYLAVLARHHGILLSDAMRENLTKLSGRRAEKIEAGLLAVENEKDG